MRGLGTLLDREWWPLEVAIVWVATGDVELCTLAFQLVIERRCTKPHPAQSTESGSARTGRRPIGKAGIHSTRRWMRPPPFLERRRAAIAGARATFDAWHEEDRRAKAWPGSHRALGRALLLTIES